MIKKSKYLKLNSSNIDKFFNFHLDKKTNPVIYYGRNYWLKTPYLGI